VRAQQAQDKDADEEMIFVVEALNLTKRIPFVR
jgi:hypothetical protein